MHSFTGDEEELHALLAMDLYIGINGCSLKTKENLEVAKQVPLDRIMLETGRPCAQNSPDCPYCDIRNSHASSSLVKTKFQKSAKDKYKADRMVKDRNEPCTMVQVLEVVAALKEISEDELAEHAWANTIRMFGLEVPAEETKHEEAT